MVETSRGSVFGYEKAAQDIPSGFLFKLACYRKLVFLSRGIKTNRDSENYHSANNEETNHYY